MSESKDRKTNKKTALHHRYWCKCPSKLNGYKHKAILFTLVAFMYIGGADVVAKTDKCVSLIQVFPLHHFCVVYIRTHVR